MMSELNTFIQYCIRHYKQPKNCSSCVNEKQCNNANNCYKVCIYKIHRFTNKTLHYNCPNMLNCYILKHFYRYSSEIESLKNVHLAGLHIHRTSHSRSVRFYKSSIAFACKTIEKYNLNLNYLDVGGGYFGIFPNKPTFQDYSDAFYETMSYYGLHNLKVIVEPGNALVASCFAFLSEVIDVKHVEDKLWFATTDGSRNDLDPFFKKTSYLSEIIYKGKKPIVDRQIVSGCTCLEYDRMFTLENKSLLSVGDRIYYNNVGAYTMCLSPMFIRYIPNIYMKINGGYEQIREKWTANEFVMKNRF